MNKNNQEMIQEFLKLDWLIQINILQNFSKKFDYKTLVEFQRSDNPDVRNLAKELALKIPAEKVDYETLVEFQKSGDSDIRNLAEELALKIPAEKLDFETLVEFQKSNNLSIKYLARKLALKHFPEKTLAYKKFIEKYFE